MFEMTIHIQVLMLSIRCILFKIPWDCHNKANRLLFLDLRLIILVNLNKIQFRSKKARVQTKLKQ